MIKIVIGWVLLLGTTFGSSYDVTEYKDYGVYSNQTTVELFDVKDVKLFEMKFIYMGRLKTLHGSVPVTVLFLPLRDMEQKIALLELLGVSVDLMKEKIESNSNLIIVDSKHKLLAKLQNTIGGLSIVNNQLVYNYNGQLVRIEVLR